MIEDLADFFDLHDFAVSITRSRLLAADVTFAAIIGEADEAALDGHAVATMRQILYATGPDIREGDTVIVKGTGALAAYDGEYRVRDPRRINDGLESQAWLLLIATKA